MGVHTRYFGKTSDWQSEVELFDPARPRQLNSTPNQPQFIFVDSVFGCIIRQE